MDPKVGKERRTEELTKESKAERGGAHEGERNANLEIDAKEMPTQSIRSINVMDVVLIKYLYLWTPT